MIFSESWKKHEKNEKFGGTLRPSKLVVGFGLTPFKFCRWHALSRGVLFCCPERGCGEYGTDGK